ncbi:MAG TPA: DNA-directed RNA polymerase subunit delta [Patescibacteria group bacterium]|nr:DNA-directed RNA polymerase subunit delta [Patescibacteria group bacterium]
MTNQNEEQKDEVSLAYQTLKQGNRAMYFRDLINEVVKVKGGAASAQVIAEVHTRINMDSRFLHMGKGMWGLVEWSPQRSARVAEDAEHVAENSSSLRREKLLAAIQQDQDYGNASESEGAGEPDDDEADEDGEELPETVQFVDLAEMGEMDEEDDQL